MKSLMVTCALLMASSIARADVDFSSYQPSSYQQLLQQKPEFLKGNPNSAADSLYSNGHEKYVITVKYSGKFVEIGQQQQLFLRKWQQSLTAAESFIKHYKQALVIEGLDGNVEIPVQQVLIPAFQAELTIGQEIKLYVVKAGWANNQPMLLATEFAQP